MPDIRHIIDQVQEDVIIVDTSNYAPVLRDSNIKEIDNGMVESVWVSKQLGRSIIKAFNNLLEETLAYKGKPEGSEGRIAMAVAGNDQYHKDIIKNIVNEIGFDPVDSGDLSESWRHQPGTPAYCTELTKEVLKITLNKADKERAPILREKMINELSSMSATEFSTEKIVQLGRKIYNS